MNEQGKTFEARDELRMDRSSTPLSPRGRSLVSTTSRLDDMSQQKSEEDRGLKRDYRAELVG